MTFDPASLIALEATAGRIEGIFSARPELGRLWRAQAALVEAARTVAMEDIHIQEGDLVLRLTENVATSAETARGIEAARESVIVLRAPGSLIDNPEWVLERVGRAAIRMEGTQGCAARPPLGPKDANRIRDAARVGGTPFLSALRAAIRFRQITEGRSPLADRLVFAAAEHAVRTLETRPWVDAQDDPFGLGLLSGMSARWTFLPATALTQRGFRSWSPMHVHGVHNLVKGLRSEQSRTLGAIPFMARWLSEATIFAAGKHGKSRLRDLVTLSTHCPVLTVSMIREALGVKQRAAYNLVDAAEAAGILTRITARQTYRVWAVPMLADSILRRPMPSERRAGLRGGQYGLEITRQIERQAANGFPPSSHTDAEKAIEREETLLSDLDAAIAKADALLEAFKR